MSAGLDIWLLVFTVALFAGGGWLGKWEYARMVRGSRAATLATFHRDGGWMRFVVLMAGGSLAGSMYFVINRASLWDLPAWLDLSLVWWCNGLGGIFFGLLFGLARAAWVCERAANLRALGLTAAMCGLGLIGATVVNQRFAAPGLSARVPGGELLLQSSNHSCAAASGANIASVFGISVSEKQMAEAMRTRVIGTSPAGIIRGLRAFGIEAEKFSATNYEPSAVPVPSILLIDFPLLGPESHAIAALSFRAEDNTLEVWDPLTGRAFLTADGLKSSWTGRHGIVCARHLAR